MIYIKPSVRCICVASAVIQGHADKNRALVIEGDPSSPLYSTGSSYDLDE